MVGKTSLCVRFVNDRFDDYYEPTYTNSFLKLFHHRSQPVEIIIKDTQGVSEQEVFRSEWGLGVHGYILVYSVTSLRSFEVVKSINAKLLNLIGSRHVPRILLGTKSDLCSTNGGSDLRQVTYEQGAALAAQWGCAFAECSAKHNINVDRAFTSLLDEIEHAAEPERSTIRTSIERLTDWFTHCIGRTPTPTSTSVLSPTFEELSTYTDRWSNISKWTTYLLMAIAIAGIAFSIWFGINASSSEEELLAYVGIGIHLLLGLVTPVGIYGLQRSEVEFLKVFTFSLSILALSEMIVWILLFVYITSFSSHLTFVAVFGSFSILSQLFATLAGYKLIQAFNAGNIDIDISSTQAYPSENHPHDYLQASYHSLYE